MYHPKRSLCHSQEIEGHGRRYLQKVNTLFTKLHEVSYKLSTPCGEPLLILGRTQAYTIMLKTMLLGVETITLLLVYYTVYVTSCVCGQNKALNFVHLPHEKDIQTQRILANSFHGQTMVRYKSMTVSSITYTVHLKVFQK